MRILWNSDQHTLHQTTPTEHILGNLSTFYYKDHNLADVQLVIKGGDLMDRLVDARDKNLLKVKGWSHTFLHRCHENDVAVLLLEGTDTHDWGQPKHLETQAPEGMDFRYVDTLRIEFYPKFNNLSILCVPDNMGAYTKDEVWEMALAELAKHNLKKVDIIAFHGAWDFQLPPAARGKHTHNQDRWESICEMLILSGHIHTPAQEGKVHCSGSFDRVAHGEEHPAGTGLFALFYGAGGVQPHVNAVLLQLGLLRVNQFAQQLFVRGGRTKFHGAAHAGAQLLQIGLEDALGHRRGVQADAALFLGQAVAHDPGPARRAFSANLTDCRHSSLLVKSARTISPRPVPRKRKSRSATAQATNGCSCP